MTESIGILVHGDNHFIVAGLRPDRATARELVRQWSVIRIGEPPSTPGFAIRTKAFREDLSWAVVVGPEGGHSAAVKQLLGELAARGVAVQSW